MWLHKDAEIILNDSKERLIEKIVLDNDLEVQMNNIKSSVIGNRHPIKLYTIHTENIGIVELIPGNELIRSFHIDADKLENKDNTIYFAIEWGNKIEIIEATKE
ncbi:hypothetical protein [Desulfuribacillus alkaliarsenatis]|uniref:Uncharacterized protein n=1 Tax=Desulfuribacillus alkaliarsenatis TaxID=766136 RepID=A0A1E5FZX9_9FIRM|nr:hypothetical protein [Desulfuribacillus alkaliarsenatis]OEF96137.1 hypothetical protein BHF68_10420 [Desulfuribacillus alkaliarsenatis]